MFECECGVKLKNPRMPVYCRCGRVHKGGTVKTRDEIIPAWVIALKERRTPEDKGPGDTFARLLGTFGEAFKATSKLLGIPCGCTARQAEWNERWPYASK